MIMNAAVGDDHHYIRNETGLHHLVRCTKHQFYANAHHECKEYIINFHLPNVETNLKISSVPARVRHCVNPAKDGEMAPAKSVQGPLWPFRSLIPWA